VGPVGGPPAPPSVPPPFFPSELLRFSAVPLEAVLPSVVFCSYAEHAAFQAVLTAPRAAREVALAAVRTNGLTFFWIRLRDGMLSSRSLTAKMVTAATALTTADIWEPGPDEPEGPEGLDEPEGPAGPEEPEPEGPEELGGSEPEELSLAMFECDDDQLKSRRKAMQADVVSYPCDPSVRARRSSKVSTKEGQYKDSQHEGSISTDDAYDRVRPRGAGIMPRLVARSLPLRGVGFAMIAQPKAAASACSTASTEVSRCNRNRSDSYELHLS